MPAVKIFSGNSNPQLAREICGHIDIELGNAEIKRFSDGEIWVEINESVRGADVYVIQSTCAPVNDSIMELLIMLDALKRASAGSISAVIPYFGYGRQDRKTAPRAPISARLVTDLLRAAGAGRLLSMELHAGQIQGFFNGPVDHLYASPVMVKHLKEKALHNLVVVSPDAGGVERARAFAKRLGATLAIIDKRRPSPNVAQIMHIVGDVADCDVVIVDDMIDTAGTISQSAQALKHFGARRIFAAATHAVLSGEAIKRLEQSPIEEIIVTNTIPLKAAAKESKRFHILSVAELFGEALRRIHDLDSISILFD